MIYWKVATPNLSVASMRYRAALPFEYLARRGYSCKFLFPSSRKPKFTNTDLIVFVKSFTSDDLALARMATERGTAIILDLCDNIFVHKYSGLGARPKYFLEMARIAAAIVTTGSALESVVRNLVPPGGHLFIVPDGLELSSKNPSLRRKLYIQKRYELARRLLIRIVEHVDTKRLRFVPFIIGKLHERLVHAANIRRIKLEYKRVETARHTIYTRPSAHSEPKEPYQFLWFGVHGAPYARFGIVDIFDIRAELEQVARSIPFVLTVVSNNHQAYREHVEPLAFKTRYYEWYPGLVESLLKRSSLVIIPNSRDLFSICKSANRAILALGNGVPVVASSTPAMEIFRHSCFLDDWVGGIHTYCNEPEIAQTHTQTARKIIADHFVPDRIADSWENILKTCSTRRMVR